MKAAGRPRHRRLACTKHKEQTVKLLYLAAAGIVITGVVTAANWPNVFNAASMTLAGVTYALGAWAMDVNDGCRCIKHAPIARQPTPKRRISAKKARRRQRKTRP